MAFVSNGGQYADSAVEPEESGEPVQTPESADAMPEPVDWRHAIDDPKLRDHAARFASPGDLAKAHLELRGKLSNAIVRPGRNASADEVAAYRRALGVPDSPEHYRFDSSGDAPPDGHTIAFRNAAAEAFHRADLTVEQGRQLTAWWNGVQEELRERQVAADRAYADRSRAELDAEWGRDADANHIHAARAADMLFGEHLDVMRNTETSDGRYLLDHPHMLRALARLGKEMVEGGLGGAVSTDERDTLAEQRDEARVKRNAALQAGNHAEARQWDAREREIIAKMNGQ
jgi:hypothetical protein